MVDHLILRIDMVMGDIPKVKFFTVHKCSGYFFLGTVFSHDFEQDRAIAMEDFVYTLRSFRRHFIELDVIVGLAGGRAEYFVSTSCDGLFAKATEALMSVFGFRYDDVCWHGLK